MNVCTHLNSYARVHNHAISTFDPRLLEVDPGVLRNNKTLNTLSAFKGLRTGAAHERTIIGWCGFVKCTNWLINIAKYHANINNHV